MGTRTPATPGPAHRAELVLAAEALQARRRALGLTQAELAERLGVTANTLARWERGELRPMYPEQVARRLARLERLRRQDAHRPAPSTAPPGLTETPRHNLPAEVSSFVGREQELAELGRLLGTTRLLTLTGAGGVGKTRLALHLAAAVLPQHPDGVWWVALAALNDPSLVPQAVATALGLHERPGVSTRRLLARALTGRVLLLLDNCEHLLTACAGLTTELLQACPGLRLVTTSREPLGIAGEQTWRVPSLSLPEAPDTAARLGRSEAARLFVERARSTDPDLILTEATAVAIAAICRHLDGIPLALELAAARARLLSPAQIAARLDDRFRLLVGGPTAPPRQQTLRATLDWSHDLLDDSERCLFRRLAVFSGGWTLEAAETVCAGEALRREDVLDLLGHLVDKSLVIAGADPDGAHRYRLLETVRAYARARLDAAGELDLLQARHAVYVQLLVEQAQPALDVFAWGTWLDVLEREHDNLRSALDWLAEHDGVDTALRLARVVSRFWAARGYVEEGRTRLDRLLAMPQASPAARAAGLRGVLHVAWAQGDHAAQPRLSAELLAICTELGDMSGVAFALHDQGLSAWHQRRYADARRLLEHHLALAREHGLPSPRGRMNLGNVARDQGDFASAHAVYGVSLAEDAGSPSMRAIILSNMGWLALYEDDLPRARAWQAESLAIRRELGEHREVPISLTALAHVAIEAGDPATARALLAESVPLHQHVGNRWGQALALEGLAGAVAAGHPDDALRLAGAADALRLAMGRPVPVAQQPLLNRWLAPARRRLSAREQAIAWDQGHALGVDDALVLGLRLIAPGRAGTVEDGVLTPRQREVAMLLTEGLSNHQIAERLVVTDRTVAAHIEHILDRLGVTSRTQIAVWAAAQGVVASGRT